MGGLPLPSGWTPRTVTRQGSLPAIPFFMTQNIGAGLILVAVIWWAYGMLNGHSEVYSVAALASLTVGILLIAHAR